MGVLPVVCAGCRVMTTAALSHEHHVIPQAAGGTAGPTERICADCHGAVHRVAEKVRAGRLPEILDDLRIRYPDVAVQRRLIELGTIAARELDQPAMAATGEVRVTFSLPRGTLQRLRVLAASFRSPDTGRRLGVAGLLRRWVIGMVDREVGRS